MGLRGCGERVGRLCRALGRPGGTQTGAARRRLAGGPRDALGPKGVPRLRWKGEEGLAARFSYRRSWSRDRSAARSPGCSTARPFSFPTVKGRVQTQRRARCCAYNPSAATTGLTAEAAAGFRKRPVQLQEPSRIFRSRRRRADGKRRRERQEARRRRGSCGSGS